MHRLSTDSTEIRVSALRHAPIAAVARTTLPRADTVAVASAPTNLHPGFAPIAFCVMPYGVRAHPDTGRRLDCDALYRDVIAPAAEAAGCRPLRADYEAGGGFVHGAMFERLLLADVVVADLSLPNPNVYYELGIRHATRPRATVTLGCFDDAPAPFDVAPLRHITYSVVDTQPEDPASLRQALSLRIQHGLTERTYTDSPLFSLVANYPGIELSHETAESYRDRVEALLSWRSLLAQAVGRTDVVTIQNLVEQTRGVTELILDAVLAYRDLGAYTEMLDLLESDTHIATSDVGVELAAFARNRRNGPGDRQAARGALQNLIARRGLTSERGSLLGRVCKDAWLEARDGGGPEADALLSASIVAYHQALEADPRDPLPGVNLATLLAVAEREQELRDVVGVVAFALARRGGLSARDYFDVASYCELNCVLGQDDQARAAAVVARTLPHPPWAAASTAANLRLLGEVREVAAELARGFDPAD